MEGMRRKERRREATIAEAKNESVVTEEGRSASGRKEGRKEGILEGRRIHRGIAGSSRAR